MGRMGSGSMISTKEIRSTKFETRNKSKIQKPNDRNESYVIRAPIWGIRILVI
jgi:hypothetical protein